MFSIEALAKSIQRFRDEKWAIPINTYTPTQDSYELAEFLAAEGFIHRSHAATLAIDDMIEKDNNT